MKVTKNFISESNIIDFLSINETFRYKHEEHKLLVKNKKNSQVKNLKTGKVFHLNNYIII